MLSSVISISVVSAQCDPTVCCNPNGQQNLAQVDATAPARDAKRLKRIRRADGRDSEIFELFGSQLSIPPTPINPTPNLNITFYTRTYCDVPIDCSCSVRRVNSALIDCFVICGLL